MKLTILGSGTMMPTKKRHPAGYLIDIDNQRILMDCGHTTLARLIDMGIDLHSIDTVCISHFHTDHFADCLPLVHARWVDDRLNNKEHKPLTIIGPEGLIKRFKMMREIFWTEAGEKYPIEFIEGITRHHQIETYRVNHVKGFKSVGFKIAEGSKILAYTGDLGSDQPETFYQAIRSVDTLLIESGSLEPRPNHYTAEQALDLLNQYGIKRLILTHVRDKNLLEIQKTISTESNRVTIAEDLATYTI